MLGKLRAWAKTYIDQKRYSPITVVFHWGMAALVVFQLWWGWRIGRLPPGEDKLDGYQAHSAVGVLLLVLVLMRGAWRAFAPDLFNAADSQGWRSTAADFTHALLYLCLIGLPLSGWAMWSSLAAEQPLSLAGVAPWPLLPLSDLDRETRWIVLEAARIAHAGFIVALLLLLPLHAGAALKHHFVDRDDVLAAMVPGLRRLDSRPPEDAETPRKPTPPRVPQGSSAD